MAETRRTIPSTRIWSQKQVAARLGRSVPWFKDNYPRLLQLGFPVLDEAFGGWDSKAIEVWLDRRSALVTNTAIEAEMLEAARGNYQTALRQ